MTIGTNDEVRLSEVIRIALPLANTSVIKSDHAWKPVNWVSVVTSAENIATQVEAGDVVLCPPSLQTQLTAEELARFVQRLASIPVAAVILFAQPAETVVERIDTLDLALIVVRDNVTLRDVHKNIAGLLADRQTQVSERGMQLYRDLSEMSREGEGLLKMANLIGRLTGKIVVIQDKRLDIQAISRPAGSIKLEDDSLLKALAEKEHLPPVLRNRKAAAKATRDHWQQMLFPNHNVGRLIAPIISGDRARGYLSIIGEAGELDLLDSVAVDQGAAACALEMAKAKAISDVKKALRGNFLEGILAGNIPPSEVERLAARLDHDTEQPHAVLTFRWAEGADISLRRIETTLNWLLSTSRLPAMVHIYAEDHVTVFYALRTTEDMASAEKLAKRLIDQAKSDFPKERLEAGMSGPVLELSAWPSVHREALQAMEVGQRLRQDDVVDYNSLGVYQLLTQLDSVPAVHSFCDMVIGQLVDYDREHRSNLVQTMQSFFDHHGNVSRTAEALFIHRNTLLYRLDRIQELTGHDLDKSDMRLALHLSLKLWQLRPEA